MNEIKWPVTVVGNPIDFREWCLNHGIDHKPSEDYFVRLYRPDELNGISGPIIWAVYRPVPEEMYTEIYRVIESRPDAWIVSKDDEKNIAKQYLWETGKR